MSNPRLPVRHDARLNPLATLIFSSRWLQLPLYLGLIIAQGVYVFLFAKELWLELFALADVDRDDAVRQRLPEFGQFLEQQRHLVAVGRGPVMQVDH